MKWSIHPFLVYWELFLTIYRIIFPQPPLNPRWRRYWIQNEHRILVRALPQRIVCHQSSSVFNWVSKAIRDCLVFALIRSVIGRAKLRHHRNQSNQELKSILIWSLAFSRASSRLPLFTLSSHRLMMMFWLVVVITENYDWIVLSGFACALLWRPPELSLLFVSWEYVPLFWLAIEITSAWFLQHYIK